MNRLFTLLGIAFAIGASGCMGTVSDPTHSDDGAPGQLPDDRPPSWTEDPSCTGAAEAGPAPLRRLTRIELDNTLRDLLGEAVMAELALTFGAYPGEDLRPDVRAFTPHHAGAHVDAMVATADKAAAELLAERRTLVDRGHGCLLDAIPDDGCVRRFVEDFGARVVRRPMTRQEVDAQLSTFEQAPTPREGVHRTIARLLNAPQLLFHVETEGSAEGTLLQLDDYAVASRISYLVLGTMPTDSLFAAAGAGELRSVDVIEEHVRQLVLEPEAREQLALFFDRWLEITYISGVPDDAAVLDGLSHEGLRDAMVDELATFLDAMVFEEGADYVDFMTAPTSYARDPRVAEIYGVDVYRPDSPPPSTGPERGGVLLRAAMLLGDLHATAPILRGVGIRRNVLCDSLPSPPSDVVNSRLDELAGFDARILTSRQQIEMLTGDEPCASCHTQINPLAFALEDFDRLGRHRSRERVIEGGSVVAEHPIDSVVDPNIEEGGTATVSSGMELAHAVANSDKGAACMAQRVFELTRMREATDADGCQLRALFDGLQAGEPLLEVFIRNVANQALVARQLEE